MEGTILQHEDTLELPSTTDKSDGTRTGTELASSVSSTIERSASWLYMKAKAYIK